MLSPVVTVACAIALASTPVVRAEQDTELSRPARRAVSRLLEPGAAQRPPFTADRHHASSIAPVLTPGTSLLLHDSDHLSLDPFDFKYMVTRGRAFSYQDSPYDPLDAPLLRIRPIDGGQEISFLLQTVVVPREPVVDGGSLTVAFPAPPIFQPKLVIRTVWVGSRTAGFNIVNSPSGARLTVHVSLAASDLQTSQGRERPASVIIEGSLILAEYDSLSPGQLVNLDHHSLVSEIADLATLSIGRDCATEEEAERIRSVAHDVTATATGDYGKVLAINRFASSVVRYAESPIRRWPAQCLEEGVGDCDDLTVLVTALLRASGIPCRQATGFLYDFNQLSAHAWVEVALPRRGGGLHWFICEPTIANLVAAADRKDQFVQFASRLTLYPIQPLVVLGNLPADHTTDLLFNWRKRDGRADTSPLELRRFMTDVRTRVVSRFTERADALVAADLMLIRELPISLGSPYEILEQPVGETGSLLRVVLENEERIMIELTARGGEADLGGAAEQEVITKLRATYEYLSQLLFEGEIAYHNLELTFSRDPHSDRLQVVRLRFGRYLIENHFEPIVKRLSRVGFLTEEAVDLLQSVHTASGGMNLYFLQELARYRRQPER